MSYDNKQPNHGNELYLFEMFNMHWENTTIFIPNHYHDDAEILYVIQGIIHVNINCKEYVGGSGDVFFINSGEMHEIHGENSDLRYYAFVFNPHFLEFLNEDDANIKHIRPFVNGDTAFSPYISDNKELNTILAEIIRLNTELPTAYTLETKANILKIVAVLSRNYICAKSNKTNTNINLLKSIIKYIDENYSESISLNNIAIRFNMSPKYFCRFFKKNFNKTFVECINAVRIRNAMKMLEENNDTITNVAISCGFSNMSWFSHVFKNIVGCTPVEYRRYVRN